MRVLTKSEIFQGSLPQNTSTLFHPMGESHYICHGTCGVAELKSEGVLCGINGDYF